MNTREKIKLIKKSLKSDLQKVDRLIVSIAKKDNLCADDILSLTKLIYDTRRNVDSMIHKYEKRLLY